MLSTLKDTTLQVVVNTIMPAGADISVYRYGGWECIPVSVKNPWKRPAHLLLDLRSKYNVGDVYNWVVSC